ncbi:hypothetical protein PDE_08043 [Penicillium oxalicum 114-2]|uniref:Uncharacterized protein n=1 Tax=Penicillium oxalicum (strain 114-2 / CGMCC 5302) TaxID=933388 RepID=S7ZWD0_PENO1|nr:hypothetical protein PDE_08043 [Penicillium oxalicum 114-2]
MMNFPTEPTQPHQGIWESVSFQMAEKLGARTVVLYVPTSSLLTCDCRGMGGHALEPRVTELQSAPSSPGCTRD